MVIVKEWKTKHIKIWKRLEKMINGNNDSLKSKLINNSFLSPEIITDNEGLGIMTNTAWQTAKSIGIISEFDFETTQKLTGVYFLQERIQNKSSEKILDYYFNPETHNKENIDATLIQFYLRFSALIGEENSLIYQIGKTIKSIN